MTTAEKKRTLLLVNPRRKYRFNWDLREVSAIMGKKTVGHPLALPLLAALTPDRYDVRIVDEELERVPFHTRPDLVGVTGLISNIRRAYEIADRFRAAGIPVVMGGPQVSFNIDETLTHADAVVVGEAEAIWEALLEDLERGDLKPVYQADAPFPFTESPVPRWDLLDTRKMLTFSVQVSRGCPHRCDFCVVRKLFGRKHRYRDLDNVIAEIEALPAEAQIAFADDNLTANKTVARELMRRLAPLKRSWSCQASVEVTQDPELLDLMARAGCNAILIGFETLNPRALEEANKLHNKVAAYETGVANAHRAGIHIFASFVVGFESDTEAEFEAIREFTERTHLSFVMINSLNIYPGTDLYHRIREEGRSTKIDPDLCNGIYPTMHYRHITQERMFTRILDTLDRVYAFNTLMKKGAAVLGNGAFRDLVQPPISAWVKLRTMWHLLVRYALSFDRFKRRLMFGLIRLVREGRIDVGAVMQYLLFISSIHGYQAFNKRQGRTVLPALRANDRARPAGLG